MKHIRSAAPLILAVLAILIAAFQIFQSRNDRIWNGPQVEMVTRWEDRIQPLRDALPPGLNRAGYIDKSIILERPSEFDLEEFLLMQYSVAPVVLHAGIDEEWIIGNVESGINLQGWLDANISEYEIQGFGFGLYLIHILDR